MHSRLAGGRFIAKHGDMVTGLIEKPDQRADVFKVNRFVNGNLHRGLPLGEHKYIMFVVKPAQKR